MADIQNRVDACGVVDDVERVILAGASSPDMLQLMHDMVDLPPVLFYLGGITCQCGWVVDGVPSQIGGNSCATLVVGHAAAVCAVGRVFTQLCVNPDFVTRIWKCPIEDARVWSCPGEDDVVVWIKEEATVGLSGKNVMNLLMVLRESVFYFAFAQAGRQVRIQIEFKLVICERVNDGSEKTLHRACAAG